MLPADEDFMRRVVAWPGENSPGYVNLHWTSPTGPGLRGRAFKTLPEFTAFLQTAAKSPNWCKDIYFCLTTQNTPGKVYSGRLTAMRRTANAMWSKALWVDADYGPGKPYATLKELLQALNKFIGEVGLPPPTAIVLTGGGVHVYWISIRPLTMIEWRPLAVGLQAEATRLGFHCDPITADAARVLRVPGTFNLKLAIPRLVELKHLGDDYDFSVPEFAALAAKAPPAPAPREAVTATVTAPFTIPHSFGAGPSKLFAGLDPQNDNVSSGIGGQDAPLDKAGVFEGCLHFQESFVNRGAHQSQGLWHLTGLACTWLEGGREIYHRLSKGYPTYTPEETDEMFDRKLDDRAGHGLGWPSCKAFENEGANCKACPNYGKQKSPLNLAQRMSSAPLHVTYLPPPNEPVWPEGYVVNDEGQICKIVEKTDKKGVTTSYLVELFKSKLRNFQAQGGSARTFQFEMLLDAGGEWSPVSVSQASDMVSDAALEKALWGQHVIPNSETIEHIRAFMASFMAKLDETRKRQATVSFGWLREEATGAMPVGFAFDGRVFMHDGTVRSAGTVDPQLAGFYRQKGSDKAWWDLLHIVTARNHPALEVIVATSFAAPLAFATGHYNGVFSAWSPGSGAHKSTSVALGAAVWGGPKLTKEKPDSSKKGVLHKLGITKNLPIYWDEINSIEKLKEVRGMLGGLTEGSGGSKLTSARGFHVIDEWQTLMLVGANASLVDHIMDSNLATDAQLHRVFEFQVEKRTDTEKPYKVIQLTDALEHNHGHMGVRYSQLLATNVARVHKMVQDALKRLDNEVQTKSEERFHCAMVAAVYVGATLANELGCDFHCEEIWEFLKTEFLRQRNRRTSSGVVAGTADHTAHQFNQFLKDCGENTIWVARLPAKKPGRPTPVIAEGVNLMHQRQIHIRMAYYDRAISFSWQAFRTWSIARATEPSAVLHGLVKHYGAKEAGEVNLAAGTGVSGARERVVDIPVLPGSPFESALETRVPPDTMQLAAQPVTATVIPIKPNAP